MFTQFMSIFNELIIITLTIISFGGFTFIQRKCIKNQSFLSLYRTVGHYFIFLFSLYFILNLTNSDVLESIFNFSLTLNNSLKILKLFLILIFLICLIICVHYAPYQKNLQFEFFYILVFSFFGLILLLMANDLIMMFLSLELQSFGLYILIGMQHKRL